MYTNCKEIIFHLIVFIIVSSNPHFQKRFLTWVCSQVILQIHICWKFFWTLFAKIWFSPECILRCFFKFSSIKKDFGQCTAVITRICFLPECILKCFIKRLLSEKALGHWLHGYVYTWACSQMSLQTAIAWKVFSTLIVRVWFLSRVCS